MTIQCAALRKSWPWNGHRCSNEGKYIGYDGNKYCHSHLAIENQNFIKKQSVDIDRKKK